MNEQANPIHKKRAKALVELYHGGGLIEVAGKNKMHRLTLAMWRDRAIRWGYDGVIYNAPRNGRATKLTSPIANNIRDLVSPSPSSLGDNWTVSKVAIALDLERSQIYRTMVLHDISLMNLKKINKMFKDFTSYGISDCLGFVVSGQYRLFAFLAETRVQLSHTYNSYFKSPIINPTFMENYVKQQYDLINLLKVLSKRRSECGNSIGIMKELLEFLQIIDKRIIMSRPILLYLSPSILEKKKSVALWLDRHPRFNIIISSSDDAWINEFQEFIDSINILYGNRIILQFQYFSSCIIEQYGFFRSPSAIFGTIMPDL
jgi:hypothetical protein